MPIFKVIFTYTQTDLGFSEVFYRDAADLASAAVFTPTFTSAMLLPRVDLTVLRKARISSVDNNRNSVVVNINRGSPTSNTDPDICSTSAVVTLNAPTTGSRRQVWMRGLPDKWVSRAPQTGVDDPHPQLLIYIGNYISALAFEGYQVRSLKKLGIAPLVYTPISSVTVVGPGIVTLTFTVDIATSEGKRLIISQLDQKKFGGLQGTFTVMNVTSRTVQVAYNSTLAPGTYPVEKGRVRPAEYEYGAISSSLSAFLKFGSRDTGRNPLGGRGRRSRRLLRLG
jgi:hypothetical protein